MSVEIQEGGVQVSQVENQDSILSFNVEGEFDSAEAKDLQESNRKGFNLRLTEDSTGLLNPPTNTENLSLHNQRTRNIPPRITKPDNSGVRPRKQELPHVLQVPESYREVDECPGRSRYSDP